MGSPTKSKILAIAPKFTAFLSICGSLGIIFMVLRSPRRRKKTMHRIMLGMSVSDLLASIWYFAGTWVIPVGTLSWFGNGTTDTIFWAAGDQNGVTCSIGGFFNQFAICTPLYNGMLALYYLLSVYFSWEDRRISKIEWLFHILPWGYASFTAIFAASTDLYGHVEWTCWVLPDELFDDSKDISTVQSKFQMIQWIFLFGIVWACIAFVSIVFVALYRKMKQLEKKMKKYHMSNLGTGSSSRLDRSTDVSNSDRFKRKESDAYANGESNSYDHDINERNHKVSGDAASDIEEGGGDHFQEGNIHCDVLKSALSASAVSERKSKNERFDNEYTSGEGGKADSFDDNCEKEDAIMKDDCIQKSKSETGMVPEDQRTNEKKRFISVSWMARSEQSTFDEFNEEGSSSGDDCQNDQVSMKNTYSQECERNTKSVPTTISRSGKNQNFRSTWIASFGKANIFPGCKVSEKLGRSILRNSSYKEHNKSRKIAKQGMLYVAAFYVTWLFPTISRITELIAGKNFFVIQFFDTFLIPLQGFFNLCIYIRPRLIIYRRRNPSIGFWRACKDVILDTD